MRPQIFIASAIFAVAIFVGLSGTRLYPFSDYPMFSYKVQNLVTYTLTVQQQEGPDLVLRNRAIFPLTKLNLAQAGWLTEKGKLPNYEWALPLLSNAKNQYATLTKINVQKIEITNPYQPTSNYKVLQTVWSAQQ